MGTQIFGTSGSVSEIGLVTYTIPHFVKSLAESRTVGERLVDGFRQVSRNISPVEGGGYKVDITYGGLDDAIAQNAEIWEWDSSWSEDPIELHPNINGILSKYQGWYDGERLAKFPETLSSGKKSSKFAQQQAAVAASRAQKAASNPFDSNAWTQPASALGSPKLQGASGLSKSKRTTDGKNPMFGQRTYLVFSAVARRTYASRELPTGLRNSIGSIVEELPGRNGRALSRLHDSGGGNWLVMPPKVRTHGDAFEIQEEYLLNIRGWTEALYDIMRK